MNHKTSLIGLGLLSLLPLTGHAQVVAAQDKASDPAYVKGYGQGQDGGVGFGPFGIVASGNGGTFIFTATEAEGNKGTPAPSTIDTDGKSFGLYAQTKTDAITITRSFQEPLTQKGDTFALDFVPGYNDAGTIGVALSTANGTVGAFIFRGGGPGVFFDGKPTGLGFVPGASHFVYTLLSPKTYRLVVTGADNFTGTGKFSGPVTGFQIRQTNSGSMKPDHNAYFNTLSVSHSPK